jgi:hypothetical protein
LNTLTRRINGIKQLHTAQRSDEFLKTDLFEGRREILVKAQAALEGIFKPRNGERMLFVTDLWTPDKPRSEHPHWNTRIAFAKLWYEAAGLLAAKNGVGLQPVLSFPYADYGHFPKHGFSGNAAADVESTIMAAGMVVCLPSNAFSFMHYMLKSGEIPAEKKPRALFLDTGNIGSFCACLESIERMETKASMLEKALAGAVGIEITFHCPDKKEYVLYLDVRGSPWIKDWEFDREKNRYGIKLPVGEYYTAPNPGNGSPGSSLTQGFWPVYDKSTCTYDLLEVNNNRIMKVNGNSPIARDINMYKRRRGSNNDNIAEAAFGVSGGARKMEIAPGPDGKWKNTGADVGETEKAEGLHVALGGNMHFMAWHPYGIMGDCHIDIVFNDMTPITASAYAVFPDSRKELIMDRGKYLLF